MTGSSQKLFITVTAASASSKGPKSDSSDQRRNTASNSSVNFRMGGLSLCPGMGQISEYWPNPVGISSGWAA